MAAWRVVAESCVEGPVLAHWVDMCKGVAVPTYRAISIDALVGQQAPQQLGAVSAGVRIGLHLWFRRLSSAIITPPSYIVNVITLFAACSSDTLPPSQTTPCA